MPPCARHTSRRPCATLRQRGAWLSILMFFLYTGIEVTLGLWAYTLLTESRGLRW